MYTKHISYKLQINSNGKLRGDRRGEQSPPSQE